MKRFLCTLPVVLALHLLPESPRVHVAVGLAAFLGHCYPVWLKFKGGKGVATAAFTARAPEYAVLSGVLFAFMLWTHRSNIQRLWRHTENRL